MNKSLLFSSYNQIRAEARTDRWAGMAGDQGRTNRALGLIQSGEERPYVTTADSCTCPDHTYRGVVCKHMTAVRITQRMQEARAISAREEQPAPGNVTRIDMRQMEGDYSHLVMVQKYAAGWESYPGVRPMSITRNDQMSLDEMIAWCENHGYTVRRWAGGARAFWGHPHPVRTKYAINKLRQKLSDRKRQGDKSLASVEIHSLDLAFDF